MITNINQIINDPRFQIIPKASEPGDRSFNKQTIINQSKAFLQILQNGNMLYKINNLSNRKDLSKLADLYTSIVSVNAFDFETASKDFIMINSQHFLDAHRNSRVDILKEFPQVLREACKFNLLKMLEISNDPNNTIIFPKQDVEKHKKSLEELFPETKEDKEFQRAFKLEADKTK